MRTLRSGIVPEHKSKDPVVNYNHFQHREGSSSLDVSDGDFINKFTGWLVRTRGKADEATFSRIQGQLYQVIGKYELELEGNNRKS